MPPFSSYLLYINFKCLVVIFFIQISNIFIKTNINFIILNKYGSEKIRKMREREREREKRERAIECFVSL
jgi:hypothetical protein